MKKLFFLLLSAVALSFSFVLSADEPPTPPGAPRLLRNGFNRVEIGWNASSDDIAVSGYKVYRDGTYLGTTTQTS